MEVIVRVARIWLGIINVHLDGISIVLTDVYQNRGKWLNNRKHLVSKETLRPLQERKTVGYSRKFHN
jgi:hypothetical protein